MVADNPRLLELRRRVQADSASVAFAQLAEECRRTGLAHHPGYLSAHVTPPVVAVTPLQTGDLNLHTTDAFAGVERELRERANQRAADEKAVCSQLAAIAVNRQTDDAV